MSNNFFTNFMNNVNAAKADKAIRREMNRSYDTCMNNMVCYKGKRAGVVPINLIKFEDWLSVDLIDEDHVIEVVSEYDVEKEKVAILSLHPEEKRFSVIDGATTLLAAIKRGDDCIYAVILEYVGTVEERALWEQEFFYTIDKLQVKKNANRTLKARASKDEIARQVMEVIDNHPILHRGKTGTRSGQVTSTTISRMERITSSYGIEPVKEVIHIWELCGYTKGALMHTFVEVMFDVIATMKNRHPEMSEGEIARRIIKAVEGNTWSGFYFYHRRTEQFCNMGDMPGAKAMLLHLMENDMRAIDLPKVKHGEELKREVNMLLETMNDSEKRYIEESDIKTETQEEGASSEE